MVMRIPQQSIVYILICFLGVLFFVILGIVPTQRSLRELDGAIAEMKVRIEERKMLTFTHQALKQRIQQQGQGARALPFPQKNGQVLAEVDKLTGTMKDISRKAKVEFVSLAPGFSSLEGNSKALVYDVVVRGAFPSFRLLLIALGGLPYVDYVEELQFQQYPAGLELRVKFWVEHA